MERRTLLAILLAMIVAILPAIIFPPQPPVSQTGDTTATDTTAAPTRQPPAPAAAIEAPPVTLQRQDTFPADTVIVESPLYRLAFSTRGAKLVGATLKTYRSFSPGDSGPAQLLPQDGDFLAYLLVVGRDTLPLKSWRFEPSSRALEVDSGGAELVWTAAQGPVTVRLVHRFMPQSYLFSVTGQISGVASGALVLIRMGPRLRSVEADSVYDFRSYAVVTKANRTESVNFSSLEPGEREELSGPFDWVAIKSKYFLAAILTRVPDRPRLGGAVAVGGERSGRYANRAYVTASLAAPGGVFEHEVYVGPQEYRRLARIGHDLEDVNPYGWIFRPIIRPFAILIVHILLWMHDTLKLPYGWVLVLFGIAVRVVLWPLNQKAMRSSMAMQAIQPQMKALQERYKKDPQKLQQELMKLYKEHGVNPFGGCLPMLIPMPVLFALFFVFANTIEFRGVPFLWLPDLSRADPYYVIPLIMGLSMYAVTKIGQIGVPPNPQAKMMLYVMPVMFTVLFANFSSGLNLYYAVSNIASIPQQWLIARERMKRQGKSP
ncbi:MAG: membrane protein insertase YidC [Gemmatimonadales bacterium]|nr:Membrane protein insertase YidC [bacterium HR33]GIW52952.1 MAG: membrane protein insertase YidC [Gemmatimonadales bacterium]